MLCVRVYLRARTRIAVPSPPAIRGADEACATFRGDYISGHSPAKPDIFRVPSVPLVHEYNFQIIVFVYGLVVVIDEFILCICMCEMRGRTRRPKRQRECVCARWLII